MPSSTTKAKPDEEDVVEEERALAAERGVDPAGRAQAGRPARRSSPNPTMTTAKKKPMSSGPREDSEKACTEVMTPERVRNVPRMVRAKVAIDSERFQTRISPRRSCTRTECR